MQWKNRMPIVLGATLMVVALMLMAHSGTAQPPGRGPFGPGSHYSVVETQGFNLLVTDNAANKLYYYATDKDAPVGSPMKLRASLDLTQVGKEEIKITAHNLENMRKKE
jgi:hypothetical protein